MQGTLRVFAKGVIACPPHARLRHHVRAPLRCPPLRRLAVRASEGDSDGKPSEDKIKRVKEVEQNLKELGIDRSTARRVLQVWKKAGATSPDSLRQLFVKRSLNKSAVLGIQLLLDAAASAGAFYTGYSFGVSRAFGDYTLALQYLAYFLGMYLGLSAMLELFSLVALQVATARYSANADAFLAAVTELAGPSESGLDVVNKARKAVSMVKVLQALQSILDMLQDKASESEEDFFRALAAYLTLERAQRVYKFDAVQYSLTEAQAAEIASVFSRYDTNDDGVLDITEFRKLCADSELQLSKEEVEAALGVLDMDKSGGIDFGEFVNWWVNKVQPATAAAASGKAPQE